ncbi:30S ribosomal protein S10 [Candidatus Gracilibacteria bacterium]|nr:30S ribosomal protein S10 [Candidatus Gracilibacteria bacterium]
MPASKKKKTDALRIVIKSFDHKILDEAVKKIVVIIQDSGADVVGPIPLPTKIQKVTVNRSTFVNKDAREQFEVRRHKRIVDIVNPNPKTMEFLQDVQIPNGVGIEVKA